MCASGLDGHHEVNYGGRGAAWISWMEGIRVERAHYYCHTSRASCFPKFASCPKQLPPVPKKRIMTRWGTPHTTEANASPNSRRCSVLSELSTYVSCNVQALVIRVGGAGSGSGGDGGGGGGGGGESVQGGARTTLSPTVLTDDIPPTFLDGLLRRTLLYIAPSGKQGIR